MKQKDNKLGIKNYLKNHKLAIFIYIFIYLISSGLQILSTLITAEMVVYVTDRLYSKAIIALLILIGVITLTRLCFYLVSYIYQKISNQIMAEINFDLSKQAFKLNSKTYSDHDTGTFVQRLISDPERLVGSLADIVDILSDFITALVVIIYVTTLNIWIGIVIVGIFITGLIIEKYRVKVRVKNRKDLRKKQDKVTSITTEIVKSEKDIKSLGLEEKLSEVTRDYYTAYKKANYKSEMTDMNFWSLRNLMIEVAGLGILILGISLLEKSLITLAVFMIIYSYRDSLFRLVWGVGHILSIVSEIKVCSDRIFSLFDENEFVTEKFGNVHLDHINGNIEFKNVCYSYIEYDYEEPNKDVKKKKKKQQKKERKVKSVTKVFDNLSFSIKPNTTVAFVGRSGCGKSTLLNLMSKMNEVDGGEVLIDGENINNLDKETLRNSISLVNQFPYIFDMTIKENLLLAKKDTTDEELENAIKAASLSDFIASLHDGLDTKVGESGIKLSGGQKQRLAIARALLRNSAIIIFDESTSSLDNFAQEDIKQSIDALKGKSTIVIVAHRLSTIRDVDKIFFLEEGKIEGIGTFDELFQNNVKFKNMFYAENLK